MNMECRKRVRAPKVRTVSIDIQKLISFAWFLFVAVLFLFTSTANARPAVEISSMFSYGKSELGGGAFTQQTRYSFSFALRFTKVSAIEVSYLRSKTKNFSPDVLDSLVSDVIDQTLTYDDTVYSANWVQNILPSKWILQPYLKVGAGRLIRKQRVDYTGILSGESKETIQESVTGVVGAGVRLFLLKNMALKGEFISYMPKFRLSTWKDSQLFTAGFSWLF